MNVNLMDNQLLASYGNRLVSYDLRSSVIINKISQTVYYSSDDINQISSWNRYLALPDDSGLISILDISDSNPRCINTLSGHTQVIDIQMCNSVSFVNDSMLMSVGFDMQIIVWDYLRNIEIKRFHIGIC